MRTAVTDRTGHTRTPDHDAATARGLPARQSLFNRQRFRDARFRAYIAPLIDACLARRGRCSILDLGGDPDYWNGESLAPTVEIHVLNIEAKAQPEDPRFKVIQGDARNLEFLPNDSFDIVHSNSLIEHVGRWADMRSTAREIRRLAPCYYVQTPNYWFPIDPHSNMPFVHWLPHPIQRRLFTARDRGFYKRAETLDQAMLTLEGTSMLDHAQMRHLFPDADIRLEKILALGKSFIAIRRAGAD